MTSFIQFALGDALSRLKVADVAGATAAIQHALTYKAPAAQAGSAGSDCERMGGSFERRRHLGAVLQALNAKRASFAGRSARPADGSSTTKDSDRFCSRRFRNAAGSLAYKLYVPADVGDRKPALVIMLHGCTQDPNDFARGTQMNTLAEEFGLIVAYPHQPHTTNAQGCWNWFDKRHQMRDGGEPAVLAGLAQELAAEFAISHDRVFVAGLSAGGAMADILSVTHPDIFAGVGVHSGLPHGAAKDVMTAFAAMKGNGKMGPNLKGGRTRKIIFHGAADTTVHPSNGERVFQSAGSNLRRPQEFRSDINVNGARVTRTVLAAATGPAIAELWDIEGGGHAWSGGNRSGSFTDAGGPDASREMIRFFLENTSEGGS